MKERVEAPEILWRRDAGAFKECLFQSRSLVSQVFLSFKKSPAQLGQDNTSLAANYQRLTEKLFGAGSFQDAYFPFLHVDFIESTT